MGIFGSKEPAPRVVTQEKTVYVNPPKPKMLDKPWRNMGIKKWDENDLDKLLHSACKFCPIDGRDYTNILLLGPIGAGKSSFFNTINTSLSTSSAIRRRAGAGSEAHSYTTEFKVYKMVSEETVKFRICDCRGIESALSVQNEDVKSILDGHVKSGYLLSGEFPISKGNQKYRRDPKPSDKIHCIVWCFQATTAFDQLDDEERKQIKVIQGFARERQIGQLVLLTKVDECAEVLKTEIHKIFFSTDVKKRVDSFAHSFGLPVSSILPMKNYCNEVVKEIEVDILALSNLMQILEVSNDTLMNLLDDEDDDDDDE